MDYYQLKKDIFEYNQAHLDKGHKGLYILHSHLNRGSIEGLALKKFHASVEHLGYKYLYNPDKYMFCLQLEHPLNEKVLTYVVHRLISTHLTGEPHRVEENWFAALDMNPFGVKAAMLVGIRYKHSFLRYVKDGSNPEMPTRVVNYKMFSKQLAKLVKKGYLLEKYDLEPDTPRYTLSQKGHDYITGLEALFAYSTKDAYKAIKEKVKEKIAQFLGN